MCLRATRVFLSVTLHAIVMYMYSYARGVHRCTTRSGDVAYLSLG